MARVRKSEDPKFIPAWVALLPFAEAFVRRGGDVNGVLERHRIPSDVLSDPARLVEIHACYGAMEDMADLLGDPWLGAKLAIQAANRGTAAIRDAAANALLLGDFLARFVVEREKQVNNVQHRLEASSKAASFEIRRTITPRGSTRQIDAVNTAFVVAVLRRGLGTVFDPARIMVLASSTDGIPTDLVPKPSLLKSRINGVKITFPPEWLWAPFSLAWESPEPHEDVFGDAQGERVLAHFRAVIEANIGEGEQTLDRFADLVGLHPRRVQRLLSANGTSYRQLREDVRRGIALDLLANTSSPISEIAAQLGFSAPSAFDRAFRQWTGKTPTMFRGSSVRDDR
ncbi:MAG: AraC family transcriptional regulator [Rhodobacteraceae bacterium]|nr:AraC family transcriptional regulator [Paracoccaceae bacterium]